MAERERDPLAGVRVGEVVVVALRLAATGRGDPRAPVGAGALLEALIRTDPIGDWSRVVLLLDGVMPVDEGGATVGRHDGIPLSGAVCSALELSRRLMRAYDFPVLLPGLVGVALLHGAGEGEATGAVLDDVLGGDLADLEQLLAGDDADARTLLGLAGAATGGEREPGACELVVAVAGEVKRLEDLRERVGILGEEDCRSRELDGIPDEPAARVLERARPLADEPRPQLDALYAALLSPSWRLWEMLVLRAVRPPDLAVAVALNDSSRRIGLGSLLGLFHESLAALAQRAVLLWAAYMVIRHREPAAIAVGLAPFTWGRDIPVVVSAPVAALVIRYLGWTPGAVAVTVVLTGAVAAYGERRSVRLFLGVAVPVRVHRRALRLLDQGRLAFPAEMRRRWIARSQGVEV